MGSDQPGLATSIGSLHGSGLHFLLSLIESTENDKARANSYVSDCRTVVPNCSILERRSLPKSRSLHKRRKEELSSSIRRRSIKLKNS